MNAIENFLINNIHARLSNGNKWLVYDDDEWTVYEHTYKAKTIKGIKFCNDLKNALEFMKDKKEFENENKE